MLHMKRKRLAGLLLAMLALGALALTASRAMGQEDQTADIPPRDWSNGKFPECLMMAGRDGEPVRDADGNIDCINEEYWALKESPPGPPPYPDRTPRVLSACTGEAKIHELQEVPGPPPDASKGEVSRQYYQRPCGGGIMTTTGRIPLGQP